jgi:hypothetical protein
LAEQEIKQIGEGESLAEYTRDRAIQSFQQIVEIHGWQVIFSVVACCLIFYCIVCNNVKVET